MTDIYTNNATAILSLCATTADKVKDISIKNGQLLFVHDAGRIVMDWNGKRTFYNQVIELETEQERLNLADAVNGKYYFVIEEGVFWRYFNGWVQLTTKPEEIVFIGAELPTLGRKQTIYVNNTEGNESISVWNEDTENYQVVADRTYSISAEEISALFKI